MATKWTNATSITVDGETLQLDGWAARIGCPVQTIISRLKRGWSEATAVTTAAGSAPSNKGKKVAPEILVGDEISQVLSAGRKGKTSVRDRALIVTSYRAGLRCCEVLALMLKDIDREARTITILHGKGDKRRVVGIDAQAWAIVEEWIRERETLPGVTAESPLFCTKAGGSIDPRQVRAMMQRRGAKAGLTGKHVHLHGLRHTMASEMAAEGVPLLDISGALGHTNASTTDRYLKQLAPTSVLDAMRSRSWGAGSRPSSPTPMGLPAVGWLDRLRADIGDRLLHFQDARTSAEDFRAVVVLF
ncbi:MAG: hypothetical protein E6Q76_03695 [Rhizobium sp.]|nr:MAG: hypothetical protein E6Q76_03695 [Rhizobium sp.]